MLSWADPAARALAFSASAFQKTYHELTNVHLSDAEAVRILTEAYIDQDGMVNELVHSNALANRQLDIQTGALKAQTGQLTKIGDAIQPLINFMGTLNELYASVFGEKAAVWDMTKVNEVFSAIGDTLEYFGVALRKTDFGRLIKNAVDASADFTVAMEDQGSELAMLTYDIDLLLGYYVGLAELMGDLAKAEKSMGDEAFEVSDAFDSITEYVTGLTTYLPIFTSALSDLNEEWEENKDVVDTSMTAFNKVASATDNVKSYLDDMILSEVEAVQAAGMLGDAGFDLSGALDSISDYISTLTSYLPDFTSTLSGLNRAWGENKDVINLSMESFNKVASAIRDVKAYLDGWVLSEADAERATGMLGDSGFDLSAIFDRVTDYIQGLTTYTPILAAALGNLSDVWAENSDAIGDGMSAFNELISAIGSVKGAMDTWIGLENDAQTATEDATAAVADEADELAGHSLTTALAAAQGSTGTFIGSVGALNTALGGLIPIVSKAATAISGSFTAAAGIAASTLGSLSGSAYGWGSSLMGSFVDGLYSNMDAIAGAMAAAAGIVESYMGVHSAPEKGPLVTLEEWGPNLITTFKKGILEELPSLNRLFTNLSVGNVNLAGAGGGGGSSSVKTVHVTINQNISSKGDADYAVREIERLMKKPKII